jgi:ribosome recycling factor
MGPIEKAIIASDLGLMPNNDGQVIRLNIPSLTEERRKQMVKMVNGFVEDAKVSIRNVRRDSMSAIKTLVNKKEISEDDERRAQEQLEAITRKFVEETDTIGKAKEHEVLEV